MERPIIKNPIFLAQRSAPAASDDLGVARDLLDALAAHRVGCVGMAANMIGACKRIIVFDHEGEYTDKFLRLLVSGCRLWYTGFIKTIDVFR